jgi:hypothetical protein
MVNSKKFPSNPQIKLFPPKLSKELFAIILALVLMAK